MSPSALALCACVAFVSGALNAVAGGGSFLLFPAVLASGLAPVDANVATTLALWPASVSSTVAYRRELAAGLRLALVFGVVSALGALGGARLLLATPDARFVRIVPFMLIGATLLFTLGPRLTALLGTRERTEGRLAAALAVQVVVACYGGYFGGGMGILMLAAFSLLGVESIHEANALKSLLGVLINGVASVAFLAAGRGDLRTTWPIVVTAVAGGYGGAAAARRVDAKRIRPIVAALAWSTTIAVCIKSWR
jgi:uncharacterized membrane protein YfcA